MSRWLPVVLLSLGFVVTASVIAVGISWIGSSFFGEWQLIFQQMKSQSRWIFLSVISAIAVGLIAMLHSYERQLISRSLGVTLLVLRLLLILVIFLTLLEPVWSWSYENETLGRVVVAVDASESMDTTDPHAHLAEKLRWARSLGMFSGEEASDQVDRWLSTLDQGKSPEWVTAEEEPNPVRREKRAQDREKDVKNSLETVTDFSRLELTAKALTSTSTPFLHRLANYAQTEVSLFAESHTSTDEEFLKQLLDGEKVSLKRKISDLTQAMNSALESDSEIPLAGVILLSDGRDTSQIESKQIIQRVSGLNVPVHTVLIGSAYRPKDLSITHIDAPDAIFEDDSAIVKSVVNVFGFENEELTVFLEDVDHPEQEPISQVITPTESTTEVSFTLEDLDVGRHRYRVRLDVEDDELRDDNNAREFSTSVVDDKANVLLLDGEGRWEFRYLHAALERDKRVSIKEVLFEQPYLGILDEPFFESSLSGLPPVEARSTPFAEFDCIVIGDVSPRHLTLEQWRLLDRYVREEGGTIVMTAGKRFFPLAYRGTIVSALLPIENLRVLDLQGAGQSLPPRQRGFRLSTTADGDQLAMFQMADDLPKSRQIWSQLPGHSWGITGDAKGGATVFAAALSPGEQATLENERKNGIVVQHFVGNGQVLWLGIDSTWRWRFRVGDLYHHRFWGQLVRWAVSFKAASSNQVVKLGLTKSVVSENEPTLIQARWDDRFFAQNPEIDAHAIITAMDGSEFRKQVELKPAQNQALMFEGDLAQLSPGEYRITLEVEQAGPEFESPEAILIVREEASVELQDISANQTLMEEIAAATGGKFVFLDQLNELPELFAGTQESEEIHEEVPLWSHWLVLVAFCCIAMTEWVTRKINGLP